MQRTKPARSFLRETTTTSRSPALVPAVFIDQDGTLTHHPACPQDPADMCLRKDAGPALAHLQRAGYRLVLVSHRATSADPAVMPEAWSAINEALSPHGAVLDAMYAYPHDVQAACGEASPSVLLRAAREHGLDLSRSWLIGDLLDDVEAGHRAGCRCMLFDAGHEAEWRDAGPRRPDRVVASFTEATADILSAPPVIKHGTQTGH